ncbi:MAG: SPOR domain-containing protein [Nitrospinae bacterium]|nr:SPOR domain-containing protein [Nitrospinota bacterium]
MVEQHRRSRPEKSPSNEPSGPSKATLLMVSVLLVGLLSFVLGYLTRGSSDEAPTEGKEEARLVMDTQATTLDSAHILEATGAAAPTTTPTPEFLFPKTLSEETADQAPVPRSDAPPAPPVPTAAMTVTPTPPPTVVPTPTPTPAPVRKESKPAVKAKPASQAEAKKPPVAKSATVPTAAPKEVVKTKDAPGAVYSIQVAAISDRNEAAKLRIQLGNKGYPAYVVPFTKGGSAYYRVRVGPFSNREAAVREAEKLKTRDGYTNTLIGVDQR